MGSRAGGNRFSRDPAPPCGSHEEKRPIVNEDEPRMNTKTDGPPSAASGTKMHLQFCALGVTMSWDDGLLGARASRPHQACHSLGHLLPTWINRERRHGSPSAGGFSMGFAPTGWLPAARKNGRTEDEPAQQMACFKGTAILCPCCEDAGWERGRPRWHSPISPINRERRPSRRAPAVALKVSAVQRDRMRAGARAPRQSWGGVRRAASQKADVHPLGSSRLPASPAPAPHDGADHTRVKQRILMAFREQGLCPVKPVCCIKGTSIDRIDRINRTRSCCTGS